ncbi:MAG TPA: DinB family protein [Verrucomicrobiae bacterium]|nr:DinB family protein [Verrucomicrobiae bacterium]
MKVEDIRTLYDYNSWANHRTLDACAQLTNDQFTRNLGSSFGSVRDTLVHLCAAESRWLDRWHGRTPGAFPSATDFPDLEAVRNHWSNVGRNLLDYIASLTEDDIQRPYQFTVANQTGTIPLYQSLQHLANHGTYHRGQVTTLLRQLGSTAVATDMIWFYRERAARANA